MTTEREILNNVNKDLERTLQYLYSSIDSLTQKASHFLSFSLIIESLFAGYIGTIFLTHLSPEDTGPVSRNLSIVAAIFLFLAVVCLLIITILAARSLKPKIVALPKTMEELEEALTLHLSFERTEEYLLEHQKNLIGAIQTNRNLSRKLARNIDRMTKVAIVSSFSLIIFVILTLIVAFMTIALETDQTSFLYHPASLLAQIVRQFMLGQ